LQVFDVCNVLLMQVVDVFTKSWSARKVGFAYEAAPKAVKVMLAEFMNSPQFACGEVLMDTLQLDLVQMYG
jgi:hypothetical protein